MALKLNRLQRAVALIDSKRLPTMQFQRLWQETVSRIETFVNDLASTVAAIAAAQATADQAVADAAAAQATADAAGSNSSLLGSYADALTITGTDPGPSASILISNHQRYYSDGTNVGVSMGAVTGLAYATLYYVYYDQDSRAGGVVTYVATTNPITAAQTGNRHTVGSVTTPVAAAPDTDGQYASPPGIPT